MIVFILIFIVSLAALLFASDKFVVAAENIGLSLGIPSFVIGVTIVAFGTSLPELATSIASVYSGSSEIVIGNVVGSNVTNILLIIGATAIVGKGIKIDYDVMKVDMTMLLGSLIFFYFAISDFNMTIFESVIFLLVLGIFLANSFNPEEPSEEAKSDQAFQIKDVLILAIAAVFIFLGAKYTIYGLEHIAAELSVPKHIVAITAVALGTSLPELIVSAAAAKRGQHAMAVGNVLGSNIFNTYAVMGISRFFGPLLIPADTFDFSFVFMVAATMLFAFVSLSKNITRWEGWMLMTMYVFFTYILITDGVI